MEENVFELFKEMLTDKGYIVSDVYLDGDDGNEMKIDITNSENFRIVQDVNGLATTFGVISWFHASNSFEALLEVISIVEEWFNHDHLNKNL